MWLRRRFRLLMIVCLRGRGCSFGRSCGEFFYLFLLGGRADVEI